MVGGDGLLEDGKWKYKSHYSTTSSTCKPKIPSGFAALGRRPLRERAMENHSPQSSIGCLPQTEGVTSKRRRRVGGVFQQPASRKYQTRFKMESSIKGDRYIFELNFHGHEYGKRFTHGRRVSIFARILSTAWL